MPAKSAAQQRFMALCHENPDKAQGKCPPKSVSAEFMHKASGAARGASLKASGHHTNHTGHRK